LTESGEGEQQLMFCKLCVKHGKSNTFTTGTDRFRKDVLFEHLTVTQHEEALEDAIMERNYGKVIEKLILKTEQVKIHQMQLAYFICKENLAFRKYSPLVELITSQKLNDSPGIIYTDVGHTSVKSFKEFISCFSYLIKRDNIDRVRSSPFYSMFIDESMDVAKVEHLIIYLRYFDLRDGAGRTIFGGIKKLTRFDAEGIMKEIAAFIDENKLEYTKLMALGSDGAPVIAGTDTGVISKIKEKNKFIFNIHCISHRLALATSDIRKYLPYLVEYIETLEDVHNYFSRSAKRAIRLAEMQADLDEETLRMVKMCPTRWLSLHQASDRMRKSLQSIVHIVQEDYLAEEEVNKKKKRESSKKEQPESKLKTLLDSICNYKFIAITYFLSDILSLTTRLCKEFQKDDVSLSDFGDYMSSTFQVLTNDYINNPIYGVHYSKFLSSFQAEDFLPHIHVLTSKDLKEETEKFSDLFARYLKDNLMARFGDEEICLKFRILDIKSIRALQEEQIPTYGLREIDWLGEFYGYERVNRYSQVFKALVNAQRLREEWQIFKTFVRRNSSSSEALINHLYESYRRSSEEDQKYPNILKLLIISSILPLSSACCERGFSALNLIKSDIRSNLGENLCCVEILICT
jgi:hypothetical protein